MFKYLFGKFAQKQAAKKMRELDEMLHYTHYHPACRKITFV